MASSATNLVLAVLVLSSGRAFSRSEEEVQRPPNCPPFHCGRLGNLGRPFSNTSNPECGPLSVRGCNEKEQLIQLGPRSEKWFELLGIYPNGTVHARDPVLEQNLHSSNHCQVFNDLSDLYMKPPSAPFRIYPTLELLKCKHTSNVRAQFTDPSNYSCTGYSIYYNSSSKPFPRFDPQTCCMIIRLPVAKKFVESLNEWFHSIASDFFFESHDCIAGGGIWQNEDEETFERVSQGKVKFRLKLRIGVGVGCPAAVVLLICIIFGLYKQNKSASTNSNSDSSSKIDFERDGAYFGVPIFAYSELEEATNNFDSTKVLGDGGFGTVYYGQLRDGREVAVKRLHENSYGRVQQFMNEIKILTHLCHQNLVTLYGCTSRHCRELLLVYEFIPNGTIADHLLRVRGKATLAWPLRLRIAIETAKALTYLHASGIIHRDVKTSNILLDNHFSVKVADFGLSRLFPTDVTHVSTAPQGTPGYVDPEYHKCYQLTEKSDVYSFGVVLIQLITSLPAVDISRERDEINLASFAVNRIQNGEFSDFLDPCLCLGSDMAGRRMVTLVAELAFQCLQSDRDHRPSMEEVLRFLKSIEGELDGAEMEAPVDDNSAMALKGNAMASLESKDGGVLLKEMHSPTSPITVSYMSCYSGSTTSSSFTG